MSANLSTKQIIAETNKIKRELKYSKIQKVQKNFIRDFIKNNKRMVVFYIALVAVETLISLSLPIITRLYLKNSFELIDYHTFYVTVSILLGLIFLFLVTGYYTLLAGMKLIMKLYNKIREEWFIRFFKIPAALKNNIEGKRLITKFLYHAQLLKLGLTNVVSQGLQAILLYAGILIYSFIFNDKLFLVLFLSAPLLIAIFFVSYFVGKFYVSREQTFNTKIVDLLADSVLNYDLFKIQNRETEKIEEMKNLIDLDTYFRIRRQLWVRYSNNLLYGIILLFGIGLYVIQTFWPFFELESVVTIASDGIILGFFSRLLFLISRAGIFFPAFQLGVQLTVPTTPREKDNSNLNSIQWDDLKIKSKKAKLSCYGNYIKDISIPLQKGDKVLFITPEPLGKTTLAKIIAGHRCDDSFIFHVNKERTPSVKWCNASANNYYISPDIHYYAPVGEILFGKNNLSVSADELEKTYSMLKKHSLFDFIFENTKTLGKPAYTKTLSNTQRILVQIAHCLINKKQLITIDHACMDSANDQIVKGLKLLMSQNPSAVIIIFASQKNNLFQYAKTYEIQKNSIQEI